MRSQLFKGKRRDTGAWIVGDLSHRMGEAVYITPLGSLVSFEVVPVTVGEYTGCEDRLKKQIFEHELIKNTLGDEIGVIRYGEYHNPFNDAEDARHIGFYIEWICGRYKVDLRKDLGYWVPYIEVFDNIHDNPEFMQLAANV